MESECVNTQLPCPECSGWMSLGKNKVRVEVYHLVSGVFVDAVLKAIHSRKMD